MAVTAATVAAPVNWETSNPPPSVQQLLHDIRKRDSEQLHGPNASPFVDLADWEYDFLKRPKWMRGRRVRVWRVTSWWVSTSGEMTKQPLNQHWDLG